MKNAWGKSRKVEAPYASVKVADWEWRVLKAYKSLASELKDPCARWFCAVRSPMTFGSWEYGDTYCRDVPRDIGLLNALGQRYREELATQEVQV